MASHASLVPRLILAHDESLSSTEVNKAFQDWPGNMQIWDRASVIQYHTMSGVEGQSLAIFCERHIFGFKLAACLRAAASGRTLYSDADVLWFGDIFQLMSRYSDCPVYGSHEAGDSLDEPTLQLFPALIKHQILNEIRCCAGFGVFNRLPSEEVHLNQMVRQVIQFKEIGQFCEQTLFNRIVSEIGTIIHHNDVHMYAPKFPPRLHNPLKNLSTAIHYPGSAKYQFWIDLI
ncbi:MAG: hypothetical protein F6K19_06105 [Cyanothece sp. SIO1E1]|nr:hypothetical protein [Cyanothece sp. SIO1E1]